MNEQEYSNMVKEKRCILGCMALIERNINDNDYAAARNRIVDIMRSINELEKMHNKNKQREKLNTLAYEATLNKIPVHMIIQHFNTKGRKNNES